ncbi:MAG: three-Cys-motif partner protein TcmP [Bacteroidales bacterium]
MTWNDINTVNEPQTNGWGGQWTERKLDAFAKYVSAYLTIMKKNPFWKTIYFDGFAGSGERKESCNTLLYQQLQITLQEEKVYKGAAERILNLANGLSFDYHYFIDMKQESLDKLKDKLTELQTKHKNEFQYRANDCNTEIKNLASALKDKNKKLASLILLDPFGMQINWESIDSLKGTRSDVWILIPTGVIVNRLLDRNCKLKHIDKLQSFFGMSEQEIKDYFYRTETHSTLFGEEEIVQKVSNPIEKIAELYTLKLKTIWNFVTEKPLRLDNSKGVPIFHFVFASNNKNAVKIAKDIINNK